MALARIGGHETRVPAGRGPLPLAGLPARA